MHSTLEVPNFKNSPETCNIEGTISGDDEKQILLVKDIPFQNNCGDIHLSTKEKFNSFKFVMTKGKNGGMALRINYLEIYGQFFPN